MATFKNLFDNDRPKTCVICGRQNRASIRAEKRPFQWIATEKLDRWHPIGAHSCGVCRYDQQLRYKPE